MKKYWLALMVTSMTLMTVSHPVKAHRLEIEIFALNHETLMFEVTGESHQPLPDCPITVSEAKGQVLAQGTSNEQGQFLWQPQNRQDVWVTAELDAGHQKTVAFSADQIQSWLHNSAAPSDTGGEAVYRTGAHLPFMQRIILGLAFIMGGWAAWSSTRNTKKLKRLESLMGNRDC